MVIEHLGERQGQTRIAQVHAMYLSDWNRWSQDAALPRPHLRVGSGGSFLAGDFLAGHPSLVEVFQR